jgi:hypothetical protein
MKYGKGLEVGTIQTAKSLILFQGRVDGLFLFSCKVLTQNSGTDAFSTLDFVVRNVFAFLFNSVSVSSSSLTLTGMSCTPFLQS